MLLLSNSIEMYSTAIKGIFATSVKVYRIPELARICVAQMTDCRTLRLIIIVFSLLRG